MDNLLDRINAIQEALTKTQRRLCKYIIRNSRVVCDCPIGEFAKRADVGRATIMRLLKQLGYDSFTTFKKDLEDACKIKFEADSLSNPFFWSNAEGERLNSLRYCLEDSVTLLYATITEDNVFRFDQIIESLINADRVNVMGLRTSSPFAKYLAYQLRYFIDAVDLSENESMIYDWAFRAQSGEVLLIITSNPVTATSLRIAEICYSRQIPVLVITDDLESQILKFASNYICVARAESSRMSVLPNMLIIEAMIDAVGSREAPLSVRNMDQLNRFLLDKKVIIS